MVETDIPDYPCLDLELLHICLVENFETGFYLIRSKDSELREQVDGRLLVIYLVCLRDIPYGTQAPSFGLFLPFLAVAVPFKHDVT